MDVQITVQQGALDPRVVKALLDLQRSADAKDAEIAELQAVRRARAHKVSSKIKEVREETEQTPDNSPKFMCDNCGGVFPQNIVKPWIRNKAKNLFWLCPECVHIGQSEALDLEKKMHIDVDLVNTNPECPWLGTFRPDKFVEAPSVIKERNVAKKAVRDAEKVAAEAAGKKLPKKHKKNVYKCDQEPWWGQ